MQEILTDLTTYGYALLFLYTLGGGMVALIAAGVLSAGGRLDIGASIAIATFANALGDSLLFYIGRYNKSAIMPYLRGHERKLAYAYLLIRRRGSLVIFLQKFIYGVKTLVPIAIGLTRYSFVKFSILNLLSSFIWAVAIGLASYYLGDIYSKMSQALGLQGWMTPLALLGLFALIYLYISKVSKKAKK